MKNFIKVIIKHIISIFLATTILISFASFPSGVPSGESLGGLYMNLINNILVNSTLSTTDGTVKKSEKLVNNISNCGVGYGLQGFDSNGNIICVTLIGTPTPVNGVCSTSAGVCSVGTKINDNSLTTCGTTRTWQCQGSGGGTTASCSYNNGVCVPIYTYSWQIGTWGSCSISCGGGTQTRTVICKRNDGITVSDSYCSLPKPLTIQSCNTGLCAPTPVNGVCSTSAGVCSVGTKINDNSLTTCGTTRTWQCQGSGGGTTASCSYNNGACAINYCTIDATLDCTLEY